MGVEICLGFTGATRLLQKRKFDTVIVELESSGSGLDLLQQLRNDATHQGTIAVGVVDDYKLMKSAFAQGANFVLSKPVSVEDAIRILNVTKGLITRMVRRFLRIAVGSISHVNLSDASEPGVIIDLSEGGMMFQALDTLAPGAMLPLTFFIPGTKTRIRARAHVVWSDPSGRAGVEFDQISDSDRRRLKQWVTGSVHEAGSTASAIAAASTAALLPGRVRLLARWMRPFAVAVDFLIVALAAVLFWLIGVWFGHPAHLRLPSTFFISIALFTAGLYAVLFRITETRMPGRRVVELLISVTNRD
ncbi:MAG TPA: PilZ domain-containing protein [Terriglobales bacterium]|nr:PilZ domain-containing protein [Terriglobales bacterium]